MVPRNAFGSIWSITAASVLVLSALSSSVGGQVASAAPAQASGWKAGQLGIVQYILHGLAVTPPTKKAMKGKINMPLFNQYGVRTGGSQKASIGFHDGTVIHLNANTDAVLQSPTVTKLKSGEIQEHLVPGTVHGIQTASALGAATGTIVDVTVKKQKGKSKTTFVVLEGAVNVKTKHGKVLVKTNQKTVVTGNKAPTPATKVDAEAVAKWADSIPTKNTPEENVALDFNGGRVEDYSSQSSDSRWAAKKLIDGSIDTSWATAQGKVSNQWVKIGFGSNAVYNIGAVVVDPGATNGHPASNDVKDFQIRVSTTGTDDANFTTVYSGTAKQQSALQRFVFSKPVQARYVEFVAVNNYGGTDAIDVAEFEAVAYGAALNVPVQPFTTETCPTTPAGCIQAVLSMINATRAQNGVGPVTLSLTQSRGTNTCVGAIGHSTAMAETGSTWNTLQGYESASFPNDICLHNPAPGENIGTESTGNELTDLQTMHADIMSKPHDAATCAGAGSPACNVIAPDFNQVGIGIVYQDGSTYLTEDFLQ